ncbi:hypothetical protein C4B63_12g203 [Trypanosoma cruzi]|uniref:Uncharacterized protein n=1 Tax=Trypanosoma cruzi TaxID=5693 RepID=A0A2V2VPW9_TRYCR|nr:hypothetical protein C4B63_12g203 [Trypanosoma cruzi]
MLLMLLLYLPFITTHCNDYSRLRCFVTLFRECIPSLPWIVNSRTGDLNRPRSRTSRSAERIATLHQLLRKLVAQLYLYRFSLAEPLPLQLQVCLEELLHLLRDNIGRDERYRETWNKLQEKLKAREKGSQKEAEETSKNKNSQLGIKSSQNWYSQRRWKKPMRTRSPWRKKLCFQPMHGMKRSMRLLKDLKMTSHFFAFLLWKTKRSYVCARRKLSMLKARMQRTQGMRHWIFCQKIWSRVMRFPPTVAVTRMRMKIPWFEA